jgi:glucan endo-1,3-alpha-glucosidase
MVHDVKTLSNLDWGESHYIGPLQNEAGVPAGAEKWITGFSHEPWREVCKYFIRVYKSGGRIPVNNVSEP